LSDAEKELKAVISGVTNLDPVKNKNHLAHHLVDLQMDLKTFRNNAAKFFALSNVGLVILIWILQTQNLNLSNGNSSAALPYHWPGCAAIHHIPVVGAFLMFVFLSSFAIQIVCMLVNLWASVLAHVGSAEIISNNEQGIQKIISCLRVPSCCPSATMVSPDDDKSL